MTRTEGVIHSGSHALVRARVLSAKLDSHTRAPCCGEYWRLGILLDERLHMFSRDGRNGPVQEDDPGWAGLGLSVDDLASMLYKRALDRELIEVVQMTSAPALFSPRADATRRRVAPPRPVTTHQGRHRPHDVGHRHPDPWKGADVGGVTEVEQSPV